MNTQGNIMKAYGYNEENKNLLQLSQITLQANPEKLRLLAEFIKVCANKMEEDKNWEHEHFSDHFQKTTEDVDLIIYRS